MILAQPSGEMQEWQLIYCSLDKIDHLESFWAMEVCSSWGMILLAMTFQHKLEKRMFSILLVSNIKEILVVYFIAFSFQYSSKLKQVSASFCGENRFRSHFLKILP